MDEDQQEPECQHGKFSVHPILIELYLQEEQPIIIKNNIKEHNILFIYLTIE